MKTNARQELDHRIQAFIKQGLSRFFLFEILFMAALGKKETKRRMFFLFMYFESLYLTHRLNWKLTPHRVRK